MTYCKNYCEEDGRSTSKLSEAQRTLYYIAENMKKDKSISEEGYRHFQMAMRALEKEPVLKSVIVNMRAEIEASRWTDKDARIERNALASGLDKALEIIDKYNEELDLDQEEDSPHPATVYVYKSFRDENAYSEEVVEVYASKKAAMKRLKEDVESAYGLRWREIPEVVGLGENDQFTPEYVSIYDGYWSTSYWVVEERKVL